MFPIASKFFFCNTVVGKEAYHAFVGRLPPLREPQLTTPLTTT